MIYQFAWTQQDEHDLEGSAPLLWHGEHLRRMGWPNLITVIFLEGFNLISASYRERLEALDYHLLDGQEIVASIVNCYPQVKDLTVEAKYWFLRWNVLYHLFKEGVVRFPLIHLDGDVILMSSPSELLQDVNGKTFVLQGCPAFTSINHEEWFEVWQEELATFLTNRANYIAKAMAEKRNPARPDREFCNVCAYEPGWFQDQDLIEFLIAAGSLPQARSEEVFASPFYWIQNPLFPGEWFTEQSDGSLKQIVEKNGSTLVGPKKLAFYHFQGNFALYCHHWFLLHQMGLGWLEKTTRTDPKTKRVSVPGRIIGRLVRELRGQKQKSKLQICEQAFQRNPSSGNLYITDIVNSCWS